jgi:hypothetical protein
MKGTRRGQFSGRLIRGASFSGGFGMQFVDKSDAHLSSRKIALEAGSIGSAHRCFAVTPSEENFEGEIISNKVVEEDSNLQCRFLPKKQVPLVRHGLSDVF